MTLVLPDDVARGVVGLVAEIRDALIERATTMYDEDESPGEAIDIDSSYLLRELVDALVEVAVKHGAKP